MSFDDLIAKAQRTVDAAARAERRATRRSGKVAEPKIVDPMTHPRRWVNLTVAAHFLEMDRRALNAYIDEGRLAYEWKGRMRKVHLDELVRFQQWLKHRAQAS